MRRFGVAPGLALLAALGVCFMSTAAWSAPRVVGAQPWVDSEGWSPIIVTGHGFGPGELVSLIGSCAGATGKRAVTASAEGVIEATLLLPPTGQTGWCHEAELRWAGSQGLSGKGSVTTAEGQASQLGLIVLDWKRAVDMDALRTAFALSTYQEQLISRVDPKIMPTRWQGIPLRTMVFLDSSAQTKITQVQQAALTDWTRAGGDLWLVGAEEANRWRKAGAIVRMVPDHGPQTIADAVAAAFHGTPIDVLQRNKSLEFGSDWPVPGTDGVPAGLFALVALIFAILVGPLNLWWVRRRGQLGLFLLTTPLLSLATCTTLVTGQFISEGTETRRTLTTLTWLDGDGGAVTWASETIFDPIPDGVIAVPHDLWVGFSSSGIYSMRRSDKTLGLDEGAGTRGLTGAWLTPRQSSLLQSISVGPERRRMTIALRSDGTPTLTNGFDASFRRVEWIDGSGTTWFAVNIEAGAKTDLRAETGGGATAPWFNELTLDESPWDDPTRARAGRRTGMTPTDVRAENNALRRFRLRGWSNHALSPGVMPQAQSVIDPDDPTNAPAIKAMLVAHILPAGGDS